MRNLSLLLSVLFLLLPQARAQELLGQLRGTVYDQGGIAVPGAVVNITSPQLMGGRSADTDEDGTYRFSALPPGDYRVEAQLAGMRPASVSVRVYVGQTARADLTLVVETAGESIVVEQSAPVVDTTAVQSGATVTRQMLRDIPNAGRDYQSAMSYAPGVVGSGNANIRGGLDNADQFYVDGINTTDPLTNTFGMNMNLDAIEEIQVITGGMDAEYGRALGGMLNIVTQSGGNEFHGSVQILYSSSATVAYKPLPDDPPDADYASDTLALNLGGPIMKDKLWFYVGVQGDLYNYTPAIPDEVGRPLDDPEFEVATRKWRSAYLFGKLTWQPTSAHKLTLHGQSDPTDIQNAEVNPYTLPSGDSWVSQGGILGSLSHLWTPDTSTILETQLYASNSYLVYGPMAWRDCQTEVVERVCQDDLDDGWLAYDADGFNSGTLPYGQASDRPRYSLSSELTKFFSGAGEHEAKIGFQAELLGAHTQFVGYADGFEFWAHNGDPTDLDGYTPALRYVYDEDTNARIEGRMFSAYIQDVWQPVPRLTVRPGLRLDMSQLFNDADDKVFDTANLGPRLGVAYDITGDGRTRAHAYYGRFYDVGWLEVSDILATRGSGYSAYQWDPVAGDWSTTPAFSVAPAFLEHEDLIAPYSDEFDIGLTRDLGDGWAVGVTGVYEETHNIWEDDDTNLIWNDDGTQVIGFRNGVNEAIFRLRTPDEVFNEYTSLEFTLQRQYDRWGLLGSYVWSHTYGFFQDNDVSIASGALDIPPEAEDEVGLQPYDRPHSVKLVGSYRHEDAWSLGGENAMGFLFGWDFRLRSGDPYGKLEWNDYYFDYINLVEPIDGTYRLPALSNLDLKAGLTFVRIDAVAIDLTAECFNVFNDRTVLDADWTYTGPDGSVEVDNEGNPIWGTPLQRNDPRYFQFGLRGEF